MFGNNDHHLDRLCFLLAKALSK